MRISILGDGAWGSALAVNLAANQHDVSIWGPFPDYLAVMRGERSNPRFLPGVQFPARIKFIASAEIAAQAEMLVLATPTQYLRGVLKIFAPYFEPGRHRVVNVTKGIEEKSWDRASQTVEEIFGDIRRYVTLSGPSHAEEVSRGIPTAVVVAGSDPRCTSLAQRTFMNHNFRVYTSDDVVGVELGGALKNVIAIAAGIIDGMGLGDNPKAALMTRGIAEMGRLGAALGGEATTFAGLSGIGDLIVTCTSKHSRNRHVGEELGRGKSIQEILDAMGMQVAEGVRSSPGAYTLARNAGVEAPIIDQIYRILYENQSPGDAIRELMTRSAKPELG